MVRMVLLNTGCLISLSVLAQNKIKTDTVVMKPTKEVEVSMDVPAEKGSIIHIVNSSRHLDIKTWPENKVKVVSTVSIDENAKPGPGVEMFERAGVTIRSTSNRVELNARGATTTTAYGGHLIKDGFVYYNDVQSVFNARSGNTTTVLSGFQPKKRTLTIFVPEGSKLDIDNKSSNIILRNNFKEARFDLTSSILDCQNVNDLELFAKYSTVNVGDVDDAEVEFENGTLRATNIKELDIDSKSSTIEYENGNNLYMRSQTDNFTIETIKKVEGRKLYGELRIDKLSNTLDIEGTNADIRVRHILPEVEKIRLNDKYADIRFPVKNLLSYTVAFEGAHSTVFAPFEKVEVKEEKKVADVKTEEKKTTGTTTSTTTTTSGASGGSSRTTIAPVIVDAHTFYASRVGGERSPTKFTASVGDPKAKRTKFELVCHSCTIDFK